ncbi:MAG: ribonucleotide reductase N-terminal alpha domain-containing protein [Betaproteobacteria bacterium]
MDALMATEGEESAMGLNLSKNALSVLEKRYLKKKDGKPCETPEDMFRRVAENIAGVESVYGKSAAEVAELAGRYYALMTELEFMPNSPTLMNAGRDLQQLAACFVLPVEDSMAGIFDSIKHSAMIHQSGGGTGFSFSRLRPKNDEVRTTGGVASGPISFMKVFNAATDAVKQGGTRRGANMGILRVDHPDILEFITAKENNNDLTNFNISVAVTDKFMQALEKDEEYELVNPRNHQVVRKLRAREVFDLIVEGAWRNGEPGIIFIDRINRDNPTPALGEIESTNPCWTGDTLVWTATGPRRFDELVGQEVPVLTQLADGSLAYRTMRNIRQTRPSAPVLKLKVAGGTVRCTPDHNLYLADGTQVAANTLGPGAELRGCSYPAPNPDAPLESELVACKVLGVEACPEEVPVYNGTVDETHRYFVVVSNGSSLTRAILSANCGEQPLLPYEACNLGSINLAKMVEQVGDRVEIDYEKLAGVVRLAVRFLDDVIDASRYPLPVIDEMVRGNRKIGLGVMGFADMLIKLGVRYDSDQAIEIAEEVMSFIQKTAWEASADLAEERGPFPNFTGSVHDRPGKRPVRNATTTTIAPTGTISIIAGCSSGIEPLFAVCFVRNVLDNQKLVEVNPLFEDIACREGFYTPQLMEKIAKKGSLEEIEEVPERYRELFVTAHQIAPEWHIAIQAAFQKHTDNAVSKTINFAHEATREDVAKAYLLAYAQGCKGVTVYRDGSREEQVLTAGTKVKEQKGETSELPSPDEATAAPGPVYPLAAIVPRPRPQVTVGTTEKVQVGCGNLYVSVNADEYGICEVFTNTGREGGCASQSEATSRLISIALRAGISVDAIYEQLRGIRCPACLRRPGVNVTSCPDAIAKAIKKYVERTGGVVQPGLPFGGGVPKAPTAIPLAPATQDASKEAPANGNGVTPPPGADTRCEEPNGETHRAPLEVAASGDGYHAALQRNLCPECGRPLNHESGCVVCVSCGYSKCG